MERGLMTGITRVSKESVFSDLNNLERKLLRLLAQYQLKQSGWLAVWSLLLASGYLKVLSYEDQDSLNYGDEPDYELTLTNHEVRLMFFNMVRGCSVILIQETSPPEKNRSAFIMDLYLA